MREDSAAGGVVVGQVTLECGGLEEFVDVVAVLSEVGEVVFVVRAEDRLRAYDDDFRVLDDLTRRPDRMFQLVAAHQPANPNTSERSSCDISPPIGETSRISTESVSTPVIT